MLCRQAIAEEHLFSKMLFSIHAPILIVMIFAVCREVNSHGVCEADQREPWSYSGENGPAFWGEWYPGCNGQNQSPIDIRTNQVVTDATLTPLHTVNWDKPIRSADITNNGHTVVVTPTDGVSRSLQNVGLPGVFKLSEIHFHWGSFHTCGSEHHINGRKFDMEMHLVHRNSRNETAVVGALFQESAEYNPSYHRLMLAFNHVQHKGDQTRLTSSSKGFILENLLPANLNTFYRYVGSLTTPGCTEGVTWTVLAEPVNIGTVQMQVFRNLCSTEESEEYECALVNNYRPIQPLNGRQVTSPLSRKIKPLYRQEPHDAYLYWDYK